MKYRFKILLFHCKGQLSHNLTIILKRYLSIIPLFLAFFVVACVEEVVIPPSKPLDSARYNWRVDFLPGFIHGAWAYDTNNIFLVDIKLHDLVKYNGNEYLRHNFGNDFSARCVAGLSDIEVYLGGFANTMSEPTFGKPQIRLWNGAVFEKIIIPDTFEYSSYVSTIFTGNLGEIWIGTNKGRVLKIQNSIIEETYIDTSQYINRFLKNETGGLYFLAVRDSCNQNGTYCKEFISLFFYQNSNWQRFFYKVYETPQVSLIPQNLGNRIYAGDYYAFYKFTGIDYLKMIDVYGFISSAVGWSGTRETDLLCVGKKQVGPVNSLFHWDGKTWSDENVNLECCFPTAIFEVQDKYVCVVTNLSYLSYIYYGTKKNK